ncbi:MAG: DUF4178 domain-containing protein [Tumebacillaceae bacterium]
MGMFDRIKSIWRANQSAGQQPVVTERTLTNLQVGDILTYDLADYKVEGVTQYRSGGQLRYGYLVADGTETRYLLVEPRETLRVYLFETLDARLDNPEEIHNEMNFEDVAYFEAARGQSTVQTWGRSPFSGYDVVYWWLHIADNGDAMLFEWQNGEMYIRVGAPAKPFEFTILAGSE